MAIQCWMCSEILVEGRELAETRPASMQGGSRAIPVLSGCCPECLGLQTGGALRSRSISNELSAA